jgi:hypothetical protein
MKNLRTLTLSRYCDLSTFTNALDPNTNPSEPVVCPGLEELVLVPDKYMNTIDIKDVVGMAAARASRGARLRSVRVISKRKVKKMDVLELEKHVLRVKCGPEVGRTSGDNDKKG